MGLLSPAERERHAHVAFLDVPIPHLDAVDLHHGHEVAQPRARLSIDARVARGVNVDFRPTDAFFGTDLEQYLTCVMTQMAAGARVKNNPWFHTATLGPWYMKCRETHSIR